MSYSGDSRLDCMAQKTPFQGEKWCLFKRSANELGAICYFKCNEGKFVYEQVFFSWLHDLAAMSINDNITWIFHPSVQQHLLSRNNGSLIFRKF